MTTENKTIQVRRDTSANWSTINPVPKAGEICFETNTGVTKIGDGATYYSSLVPLAKSNASTVELDILDGATITTAELNILDGVTATASEINTLDGITATTEELNYTDGVTSNIQTQLNSKFDKADVQIAFGETLSDTKTASEKLIKNSLDEKQNVITHLDNMLKASVLSSMNIIGENNEGRIYDEPKTYAKMLAAAHSTFDLSKFTVVGTPNISENGIASGFSNNNFINLSPIISNISNYTSVTYKGTFKTGQDLTTQQRVLLMNNFSFMLTAEEDAIRYYYSSNGSSWDVSHYPILSDITANTEYRYEVTFTTTGAEIKVNDVTIQNTSGQVYELPSRLGQSSSSSSLSIDLKQVSVFVDGAPVFNGNKTELDVLKADNYTVVGTPTISTDGIASGFSNNNFIDLSSVISDISNYTSVTYKGKFKTGQDVTTQQRVLLMNNFSFMLVVEDSAIRYYYSSNGSSWAVSHNAILSDITANTEYRYEVTFTTTGVDIKVNNATAQNTSGQVYELPSRLGQSSSSSLSIDLNVFEIYVNGSLDYQPCLKIPYTLAANGKKFIDIIYNDRARVMFEQFGAAPYTIIDESNNSFILPYGSVDSKVGPKILVDSYYNGASSWEQYLDRTMIQKGSMTADTPVTFPCEDEFTDTNYSLSCPYSAKSKTGFTPTVSGEYIAIGSV